MNCECGLGITVLSTEVCSSCSGKAEEGKAVSYHLNVRPALDNWSAFVDRFRMSLSPYIPSALSASSSVPMQPANHPSK